MLVLHVMRTGHGIASEDNFTMFIQRNHSLSLGWYFAFFGVVVVSGAAEHNMYSASALLIIGRKPAQLLLLMNVLPSPWSFLSY